MAGRIEGNAIRAMFTPKKEIMEDRGVAVLGKTGSECDMSKPAGCQSCWNIQGSG